MNCMIKKKGRTGGFPRRVYKNERNRDTAVIRKVGID